MLVHLHIHNMCIYQFYRFDDALCMSIISGVVNFGTLGQERAMYAVLLHVLNSYGDTKVM